MPELPEVETTVRGITPAIQGKTITDVIIRCYQLRWPILVNLQEQLISQTVQQVLRRGKYIIIQMNHGALMIHLGMSGRLCVLSKQTLPQKHDHVDIVFNHECILRYTDPRRFGAILWTTDNANQHPLLQSLGKEPLTKAFDGDYLFEKTKNRKVPIKPFIMDSKIVVGVGNIYAAEALFLAGIDPRCMAGQLSKIQITRLVESIKKILAHAIQTGGSTLKDFLNSDGKPGYFTQHLNVYGRKNQPCYVCQEPLQSCILGQRSTVFCARCQSSD